MSTRTTAQRTYRLGVIYDFLKESNRPRTIAEIAAFWRAHSQRSSRATFVTIDSIGRDVALLVSRKVIARVRSTQGHEMGNGRWFTYSGYEVVR